MTTDTDVRPRRFSEGVEHMPSLESSARVGSFADGMVVVRLAGAGRVGTFAGGQVRRPDSPAVVRVGTFADQFVPAAEPVPIRPRLGVAYGRPRPGHA